LKRATLGLQRVSDRKRRKANQKEINYIDGLQTSNGPTRSSLARLGMTKDGCYEAGERHKEEKAETNSKPGTIEGAEERVSPRRSIRVGTARAWAGGTREDYKTRRRGKEITRCI